MAAAFLLDQYLNKRLENLAQQVAGQEREALIEFVRSVDLYAYFLHFFPTSELTPEFAARCVAIQHGIGPILCALLPQLDKYGDGIPLFPSEKRNADWADFTLEKFGQLAMLRRLAHCERYGLTRSEIHSDNHISIHVLASDVESEDRKDHAWVIAKAYAERNALQDKLNSQLKGWALDRIDKYVGIWRDHFIQYESDTELHELYRQQVQSSLISSPEADSLPDDAIIGKHTFGEWKGIVITAVARAMLHISFATRLSARHTGQLDLRNLLTIHVRQDDLLSVWEQQIGVGDPETLGAISDVFMMTAAHAEEYYDHHDYPLPYNIRFGKYFALLPQFGQLGNACTFLVTELKRKYRKDWDRAVNLREKKFQEELYELLPEPCYLKGRSNVVIRDDKNTISTDIDAVLLDRGRNCIYLFQLKWFDIFGLRLNERQSKLKNLIETGSKWIERVEYWLRQTPRGEVLKALGFTQLSEHTAIRLVILTRNAARFSGSHCYDKRAAWFAWQKLCRVVGEGSESESPLESTWVEAMSSSDAVFTPKGECTQHDFQDLRVDIWE